MKRAATREHPLPPYSLSLDELQQLVDRLSPLFSSGRADFQMVVWVNSDEFSFDSIEELRSCTELRGHKSITTFRISLRESPHSIYIQSRWPSALDSSTVSAHSDHEGWPAGAVETVKSFILPRKSWYSFILWPVNGYLIFFSILASGLGGLLILPRVDPLLRGETLIILQALPVLAALLYVAKHGLPMATLRVTTEPNLIRRYAVELTVGATVVAAAIALIGLLRG